MRGARLNTKKNHLLWILVIIVVGVLGSCNPKEVTYIHLQGKAQGTTFSIKYLSPTHTNYAKEVDSIFKVIDQSLSIYQPNSLITQINEGKTETVLDSHFIKVFQLSKKVYEETNGAFDPTVGLLVNAYGFGPHQNPDGLKNLPIDALMTYVGFDKIHLEDNVIIKDYPETTLDFNGIAQGYTVDVIKDFLRLHSVQDFMIELGGEVFAQGKNPQGKNWSIGIQNPNTKAEKSLQKVVKLKHQAIATSGNYRKYIVADNGQKYVHTIDPRTGINTPSNLLSATVIAHESCALADAYATALMVKGLADAKAFLKLRPELEYYLIYADINGNLVEEEK